MSRPQAAPAAKLVIGIFAAQAEWVNAVVPALAERFGAVEMVSPWFDFDFTAYYHAEMGRPLRRRLFVFRELIAQESLPAIKCFTNTLEQRGGVDGRRRVNIDPGYLLKERFVLATGKNFSHRIYLSMGIYADLTLIYQNGVYQTLPWTYPDYATEALRAFLLLARRRYTAIQRNSRR